MGKVVIPSFDSVVAAVVVVAPVDNESVLFDILSKLVLVVVAFVETSPRVTVFS